MLLLKYQWHRVRLWNSFWDVQSHTTLRQYFVAGICSLIRLVSPPFKSAQSLCYIICTLCLNSLLIQHCYIVTLLFFGTVRCAKIILIRNSSADEIGERYAQITTAVWIIQWLWNFTIPIHVSISPKRSPIAFNGLKIGKFYSIGLQIKVNIMRQVIN